MVRYGKKLSTFQVMPKVPHYRVDFQQFTSEGAVPLFDVHQFPGEASDRPPYSFEALLKCGTNSCVSCNDHIALQKSQLQVSEERGFCNTSLDLLEDRLGALRPAKLLSSTFVYRQQEVKRLRDSCTLGY